MKKIVVLGALCGAILFSGSSASALIIGDSRHLGYIEFGIPAGDDAIEAYLNHLLDMDLGTTGSALGQDFTRTANDFGVLPDADLASRTTYGDTDDSTVNINLGTGYLYLMAKYDGPNYGTEVWYVGGLTGVITLPSGAGGSSGSKYGISGSALFNGSGTAVPDGGSTLLLLGAGMSLLGACAMRFKR